MDWRNGILILCFVIFTPYVWEYLAAFYSGVVPAQLLSGFLYAGTNEYIGASVIIDGMIYSFFACFTIAVPLGVIAESLKFRHVLMYSILSAVHLLIVFSLEHIETASLNWPLVFTEVIAFAAWLFLATRIGAAMRRFYRTIMWSWTTLLRPYRS